MISNISTWQFILIIIVIILLGWLLYKLFNKPTINVSSPTNSQSIEPMSPLSSSPNSPIVSETNTDNSYVLYNFYSPKCPACRNFSSIWKDLTNKLNNNKNIITRAIDVTLPENEHIVFYYNISQLPTIILVTPDKSIEYTGNRTVSDLENFLNSATAR